MGLYGNIIVEPADPDYWPPVNREIALTLDDILIEDGKVAPFSRSETNYTAMGRFGNVLLVERRTDLSLTAQAGEVVRLYLTNTANTRVFNVALPGARMKLVGGDSGRVEREEFVDDGAARAVGAGRRRRAVRRAGRADARAPHARADLSARGDHGRRRAGRAVARSAVRSRCARTLTCSAERERVGSVSGAPNPTRRLRFVAEMDMGAPSGDGPVVYACPMHPEVRQRGARELSGVRHEAAGATAAGGDLRLPDAPRGRQRAARPLPEVRHEARASAARSRRQADEPRASRTST